VALRHHLRPFDERELDAYLDERLSLAGYTGKGIFKRSARREIFRVTGGVPRLVNIVCDGALLAGYARGETSVGADVVREVARDLELEVEGKPLVAAADPAERAPERRGWLRRLSRR
jgi:hypothetical protein